MPKQVMIHGLSEAAKPLKEKVHQNSSGQDIDLVDNIKVRVGVDQDFKLLWGQISVTGINLIQSEGHYTIVRTLSP